MPRRLPLVTRRDTVGLFERVRHHLDGAEVENRNYRNSTGGVSYPISSFGPVRWIRAVAGGRISAIDLLAMILFAVRGPKSNDEEIVRAWSAELDQAVYIGAVKPRDPTTSLRITRVAQGWDWLVTPDEAEMFLASRGVAWSFANVIEDLLVASQETHANAASSAIEGPYWEHLAQEHGSAAGDAEYRSWRTSTAAASNSGFKVSHAVVGPRMACELDTVQVATVFRGIHFQSPTAHREAETAKAHRG